MFNNKYGTALSTHTIHDKKITDLISKKMAIKFVNRCSDIKIFQLQPDGSEKYVKTLSRNLFPVDMSMNTRSRGSKRSNAEKRKLKR